MVSSLIGPVVQESDVDAITVVKLARTAVMNGRKIRARFGFYSCHT